MIKPANHNDVPSERSEISGIGSDAARAIPVAIGILLVGLSFIAWFAYLVLPLFSRSSDEVVGQNAVVASVGGLLTVSGILLLISGLGAEEFGISWIPPHLFALFPVLFVLSLLIGQGALWIKTAAAWTFPPIHVMASILTSLMILAYAAPRLANSSMRGLALSFAWGGVGSVVIAFVSEIALGVILLLIGAMGAVALLGPNDLNQLGHLLSTSPANLEVPGLTSILAANPQLFVFIGVLVFIFLSLLVPLIEETSKAVLPAIRILRRPVTISQALWWALCAGAGYAFSENLLNGLNAIGIWFVGMGLRGGTSFMHIATTGTVGIAFYSGFVERRFGRMIALFLLALSMHGFWNLAAISLSALALTVSTHSLGLVPEGYAGLLLASLILVLALLIVASLLWIVFLVRWCQRRDSVIRQPGEFVSMPAAA